MSKIKILIVDDSSFVRKALIRILETDPLIEVAGVARDGKEATEKVIALAPDVITLDIMMPGMDGIETLKTIMRLRPTPVLMLSQFTHEGAELTLSALEIGAMDFVDKSTKGLMDFSGLANEIVSKIKAIAGRKPIIAPHPSLVKGGEGELGKGRGIVDVVAIGTSTGGPPALQMLLPKFPGDINFGILIVQHMPYGFTGPLANRLDTLCQINVKEAKDGDKVEAGVALVAPSGFHMKIEDVKDETYMFQRDTNTEHRQNENVIPRFNRGFHEDMDSSLSPQAIRRGEMTAGMTEKRGLSNKKKEKKIKLDMEPSNATHRPSVDILFQSVAENFGSRSAGVILTGMGSDGARGIQVIKECGGITFAQDEATSTIFGMPKVAIERGVIDKIVPITSMAEEILKAV